MNTLTINGGTLGTSKNYFDLEGNSKMKLSDFSYNLPEDRIAQYPIKERDASRLMVLNRETEELEICKFKDIINYLNPGDCLVLNDTKVFPARLIGTKDKTGAKVEVFLLRNLENGIWEVLVKPARRVRLGNKLIFKNKMYCDVIDNTLSGGRIVEFHCNGDLFKELDEVGHTPLPPYIKRQPEDIDKEYYQTVYAKCPGAVAAPTAGLHFTLDLLNEIKKKDIIVTNITLHVGLGSFKPVQVEDISRHQMDSEYYEISEETTHILNKTKEEGRSIIAVGTSTVRVLETIVNPNGYLRSSRGWTDKFIHPPYKFQAVDHLITNFHLPKSTLLMLVSAFTNHDLIMKVYKKAIKSDFRFFSYGDAMYII
jgi:S-adenosylmethionine:tRNA ribosyltransferase-isomerase